MSELIIVTYNIHCSPDVWAQLVNLPALRRVDVLLLQEVPRSLNPLPRNWSLVLPPPVTYTTDEPTHPRSAALISPRLLPVALRDVVGVDLQVNKRVSVRVVSVYDLCAGGRSPANRSVRKVLPTILASSPPERTLIIAGNFNLHHPSWDPSVLKTDDNAEESRLIFEDAGLVNLHKATEATRSLSRSSRVLDLVLGNLHAEEQLVSSFIDEEIEYRLDHRPICNILAVERAELPSAYTRRLFRKADPAAILRTYAQLAAYVALFATLLTPAEVDTEAEALDLLLRETVLAAVCWGGVEQRKKERLALWIT